MESSECITITKQSIWLSSCIKVPSTPNLLRDKCIFVCQLDGWWLVIQSSLRMGLVGTGIYWVIGELRCAMHPATDKAGGAEG